MNVKPLGQRVLIERLEAETKTASGIIIPDSAQEKQQKGKIIAISKEIEDDEKNQLKVGHTVIYGKYSGSELNVDDKDYLMMNVEDVLAIV